MGEGAPTALLDDALVRGQGVVWAVLEEEHMGPGAGPFAGISTSVAVTRVQPGDADGVREASGRFYAAYDRVFNGDAAEMPPPWSHDAVVSALPALGGPTVGWN